MSTADEYIRRSATALHSSARAPRRPFHRPQYDVAAHPKRRPGAQTAIGPPRWLTWAGSGRARAPASPPSAAAICSVPLGSLSLPSRAAAEILPKRLREDSGSGMMFRKGIRGPVMREVSAEAIRGLN